MPCRRSEYGLRGEISADEMPAYARSTEVMCDIGMDIQGLVRTSMSMMWPRIAQITGMAVSRLSGWIAFFAIAQPVMKVCKRDAAQIRLCVDYGGLDVLVVSFGKTANGWAGSGLAWYRRRAAAPK